MQIQNASMHRRLASISARLFRTLFATATCATLAACASTSPTARFAQRTSFTLQQTKPLMTTIDLGPAGESNGDTTDFEAVLLRDGAPVGVIVGDAVTMHEPGDGVGSDTQRKRLYTAVLCFDDGSQITALGVSRYHNPGIEMTPGEPQTRPIVGGTGIYLGARGQITTTRNADGTYTQLIELLNDQPR
ncbi:MAG: hypothetical protein EBR71_06720 [Planctomycetes bacterium]|nr:hypothetical protein [Planctomycetota bacterium]